MADTPRTLDYLLTQEFQSGQPDFSITSQQFRDFLVSVNRLFELYSSPSYGNDAAAASGGVPIGQIYRNGNFVMVRVS